MANARRIKHSNGVIKLLHSVKTALKIYDHLKKKENNATVPEMSKLISHSEKRLEISIGSTILKRLRRSVTSTTKPITKEKWYAHLPR